MQGEGSATVPEQNERGNECMLKNQLDTCIFAIRFSSFYKPFKNDFCKNRHLSPFANSNQILTSLSEKRLQKA